MFARVSTIIGKPEQVDQVVSVLNQPNPPGLEAMKGAYLLVNRKTGKVMTITLWETEATMEASASVASQVRGQAAGKAAAAPPTVELYEVAAHQ
jgi:heme-degrading monooxygenase HmoA